MNLTSFPATNLILNRRKQPPHRLCNIWRAKNRYAIGTEYDDAMAYKITVVRFSMAQNAYQKYIATTIATNVSEESVAYISEHAAELQGLKY